MHGNIDYATMTSVQMTSLRLCLERDRFNNILDSSDHFLLHARLSHCSYLPPGNITSTWMRGHRMNNQVLAFLVGEESNNLCSHDETHLLWRGWAVAGDGY
ncbi:hypothetical protein AVEN_43477-1 [Araneus ventricosus]|uniref:Uncharacterized protein n=1 Tax=Araneus ventricosus TaxID=182803 RepID=A0A4Y2GQ80_ARAVE|nr:hypothetical protein AVEN_43477-1 [Araneus ventricosus]